MPEVPAIGSREESLHFGALPGVGVQSHSKAEGLISTTSESDPLAFAIAQGVAAPVIVRIAGLPASSLDRLRSEATLAALADLERTRDELSALQDRLRESLYKSLPRMPSDLRGRALRIQRACYNRRPIAGRDQGLLERLRPWAGSALGELVHAEGRLQLQVQRFQTAYSEERDRVRLWLLALAAKPDIARALALASRTLVGRIPRLERKAWSAYGRKERGAERSLVRYLSRAAVKLSPYSTFTKIGLGAIVPSASLGALATGGAHQGIHLSPKPWSAGSLVRLKSYIPNQWMALLQRVPVIRRGLTIQWNGSLELLPDGLCRFFRPLSLVWQPAEEDWQFVRASRITVRLSGAFHEWVVETLGTCRMPLATAAHRAAEAIGVAPEAAEAALGHYLDLGVLQAARPWPTYSAWPEQELAIFLRSDELAKASELVRVREAVDQLVESERCFGEGSRPVETLERIEALARTVFDSARDAAALSTEGLSDQLRMETSRQDVYEDVFERSLLPQGLMAGVDRAVAEEILDAGDAFWQLRGLFSSRHEVRHTFWQEARCRWPGRGTVPCLEFFSGLEATAKQYAAHLASGGEQRLFNPLGLDEIEVLGRLRSTILQELDQTLRSTEEGDRLALADARRIGALIPNRWRSLSGPCLPVQPTGPDAATWVTHHMTDGIGRLSSRFNCLLDGDARRWFIKHWAERSSHSTPIGEGELLDLLFTQLTTIGRHWPQTTTVFESLGETAEAAEQR
ncbi:MAG: lantibiotic dehydratase, partial [Planctomycetota bacterium]